MLSGWPVELSMAVLIMFNTAVPVAISPVVEADWWSADASAVTVAFCVLPRFKIVVALPLIV